MLEHFKSWVVCTQCRLHSRIQHVVESNTGRSWTTTCQVEESDDEEYVCVIVDRVKSTPETQSHSRRILECVSEYSLTQWSPFFLRIMLTNESIHVIIYWKHNNIATRLAIEVIDLMYTTSQSLSNCLLRRVSCYRRKSITINMKNTSTR